MFIIIVCYHVKLCFLYKMSVLSNQLIIIRRPAVTVCSMLLRAKQQLLGHIFQSVEVCGWQRQIVLQSFPHLSCHSCSRFCMRNTTQKCIKPITLHNISVVIDIWICNSNWPHLHKSVCELQIAGQGKSTTVPNHILHKTACAWIRGIILQRMKIH